MKDTPPWVDGQPEPQIYKIADLLLAIDAPGSRKSSRLLNGSFFWRVILFAPTSEPSNIQGRAEGQSWWRFGGGFGDCRVRDCPERSRILRRFRSSPHQSSTGIASHARGHRFESCSAHHTQRIDPQTLSAKTAPSEVLDWLPWGRFGGAAAREELSANSPARFSRPRPFSALSSDRVSSILFDDADLLVAESHLTRR